MSELSAFTCTPRQVRKHIIRCITRGVFPFVESSPGMGKSAIFKSIADEFNLQLIDIRLSTMAPEDLSGLPYFSNGKASFMPFDVFPTQDQPLPPGKDGWFIFLDEMNSGTKMVQAASYKLILDQMVAQLKLHDRVVMGGAGNMMTDRAIVNTLSTAMQSRMVHLTMRLDFDEFLEDVAFKFKWDSRIIAYLSYQKKYLHDFSPDHTDKTFCSPRTWEFMHKLIHGLEVVDEDAALYAGAISSGVATDFINFTKVYATLIRIADVIKDPKGVPVPSNSSTKWATITHLIEEADEDNFDDVTTYVNRYPSEFRVLFFRGLMIQKPELKTHRAYRSAMVDLSRYLYDDDLPTAAAA